MKIRLLLPLLAALAACGDPAPGNDSWRTAPFVPEPLPFEPAGPNAAPDPSTYGPYPVGVRTVTWYDKARPTKDGSPRPIVTEIWYPAKEVAREGPFASYDLKELMTADQRREVAAAGITVPLDETKAMRDAPVRDDHVKFPLVVFSHGQGGIRWQSTFYTVALASHGYVVVSPDHYTNTLGDLLADKLSAPTENLEDRPADVSFLITQMKKLPAEDALSGVIDLDRVGLTGHSFGGLTSYRAAAMDKRIKVIVPQAPPAAELSWVGLPTPVLLGIPVLVEAGHKDKTLPWDEHISISWPLLQKPRWLVDFKTGGHFTFSDLCAIDLARIGNALGFSGAKIMEDGCGGEAPPAAVAQPLINHYAIALFNSVLRDSPGAKAQLTQEAGDALTPGVVALTADP